MSDSMITLGLWLDCAAMLWLLWDIASEMVP